MDKHTIIWKKIAILDGKSDYYRFILKFNRFFYQVTECCAVRFCSDCLICSRSLFCSLLIASIWFSTATFPFVLEFEEVQTCGEGDCEWVKLLFKLSRDVGSWEGGCCCDWIGWSAEDCWICWTAKIGLVSNKILLDFHPNSTHTFAICAGNIRSELHHTKRKISDCFAA